MTAPVAQSVTLSISSPVMLTKNGVGNWTPPLGPDCPGTLWDGPAHTVLIDPENMSIKLANPTANALNVTRRMENPSFVV
jgi:hypothetical protein